MGYYTQYLSTIFKGPWATALKERIESKRTLRNLKSSDRALYKDLPRLVEKEHKVTKASSEEDKIIRELKEAAANGYTLAFNASTMDMSILAAVNHLVDAWSKLSDEVKRANLGSYKQKFEQISRLFVALINNAIRKAEKEEREEYKDIMVIVNETANKDHSQFMQAVRLRFQSLESQTMLAQFAIRAEIRHERQFIAAIENISKKCIALVKDIESTANKKSKEFNISKANIGKALNQFEDITKNSSKFIERAFYNAYLIKKRDFLLIMKIIVNANVLKQLNRRWLALHFMPEAQVKQKEIDIGNLEEKISKEFHTIGQALRISIAGIQKLESRLAKAA